MTDIIGTDDNDVLDNGAGGGTMTGLNGDDYYYVDDAGDAILENDGAGYDGLETSVTYTLPDNVEYATYVGFLDDQSLTGNALANDLSGGSASGTTLDGAGGDDALHAGFGNQPTVFIGGTGNDVMDGSTHNDVYMFKLGDGQDTINEIGGTSDVVAFDASVASWAVSYERSGGDLIIHYGSGDDQIYIPSFFTVTSHAIEAVGFDNGESHSRTYIQQVTSLVDVTGTSHHDVLNNGIGGGQMTGLGGNDTYIVNHVADVVVEQEGGGYDTVESTINYTLPDNVEGVLLTGDVMSNTAIGNDGDNSLSGQTDFSSVLDGRGGNDELVGGSSFGSITSDNTYIGGTGDDAMYGTSGDETYMFRAGDGQDTIYEQGGTDSIVFDASVDSASAVYVQNGNNLEIYYDDVGSKIVVNDYFYDSQYAVENISYADGTVHDADYVASHLGEPPPPSVDVYGTSDNDFLDNGTGGGLMVGYTGDDYYLVNSPGDVVVENLGEGYDLVEAKISYTMADNVEALYLTGSAESNIGIGNDLNNFLGGLQGIGSTLDGRGGNDSLSTSFGDDTLIGGTGDDTIDGYYGNDTFVFSAGDNGDVVFDSGGEDRILFDSSVAADSVTYVQDGEALAIYYNEGHDRIFIPTYFRVTAPGDGSNFIETVQFDDGTVHDAAYIESHLGVAPPPPLYDVYGTAGDDILDNNYGGGLMVGYTGDDYYLVSNPEDTIVEDVDGGYDVVEAQCDYTMADNVEFLYLTGLSRSYSGTGNDGDNDIFGPQGTLGSTLDGRGGDDHLIGGTGSGGGNDTLTGGTGDDTLGGGFGDDTYLFRAGDGFDRLNEDGGTDRIVFDATVSVSSVEYEKSGENLIITYAGGDEIFIPAFYRIPDTPGESSRVVESVQFADGTVHDLDFILAQAGDHRPVANDDSFSVGFGEAISGNVLDNDSDPDGDVFTIITPSVVTAQGIAVSISATGEFTYSGEDLVGTDSFTYTVTDGIKSATATVSLEVTVPEGSILGTSAGDHISGASDPDTILGLGGNDVLNGNGNDDVLYGGSGNDNLQGDGGYDLLYGGSGDDNLDGGTDGDELHGGDGNDHLQGGGGDDFLLGGAGNDNLDGGANNDVLSDFEGSNHMLGGGGNDYIESGDGDDTIDGGADNDAIFAGDGNNRIDGGGGDDFVGSGGGNDSLDGGAGNDEMYSGAGNDILNGSGGNDFMDGEIGNDTFDGGSGNDTLVGDEGDDVLQGGGNNDFLYGDAGTDILTGGSGADVFAFSHFSYGSVDTVTDFNKTSGDKLDISDILAGHYHAGTDALTDFVEISNSGANSIVKVDLDGTGTAYGWTQIATLQGVTGLTNEAALVTSGNLIVS